MRTNQLHHPAKSQESFALQSFGERSGDLIEFRNVTPTEPQERAEERIDPRQALNAARNERALALGIFRQAAADLRKFRNGESRLARELYRDALDWVGSDDSDWPYSFMNVCRILDVPPESTRDEMLADAQSGWYSHSRNLTRAIAKRMSASLSSYFRPQETLQMAGN